MVVFNVSHLVEDDDAEFVVGEVADGSGVEDDVVGAHETEGVSVYPRVLRDEDFNVRHVEFAGDLVCPVAEPGVVAEFNVEIIAEEDLAEHANKDHRDENEADGDGAIECDLRADAHVFEIFEFDVGVEDGLVDGVGVVGVVVDVIDEAMHDESEPHEDDC